MPEKQDAELSFVADSEVIEITQAQHVVFPYDEMQENSEMHETETSDTGKCGMLIIYRYFL